MRILIAGGTGLLGSALVDSLRADAHAVTVLTRRPRRTGDIAWSPGGSDAAWMTAVDDADAVINLAGEGIADRRWTPARKAAILDSRIRATRALAAAITGAYVALADAVEVLRGRGAITGDPLPGSVAAISVGVVDGEPLLDLDYEEDVRADTDMNVVMTGDGAFVEVQGTAESAPFDRVLLDRLLDLATAGCAELTAAQQKALSA